MLIHKLLKLSGLVAGVGFGLAVSVVHGAAPPISNDPLNQLNSAKPNIVFTLDNSGSMQWDFMPDAVDNRYVAGDPTYYFYGMNTIYYNPSIRYTPAKNSDNSDMPEQNSANTVGWTKVRVNPFLNTTTINLLTNYPGREYCTNSGLTAGCADHVSGPFTSLFESGGARRYRKAVTGPAHYYTATGAFQWSSAGPAASQNAGNTRDIPTGSYTYQSKNTNFTRVDICPFVGCAASGTPKTFTKAATRTDCAGPTCTYAEEMTNFANWYAYYRTRYQTMKTGVGQVFVDLDSQYRIGFHTIAQHSTTARWLNVNDFGDTQKSNFFSKMYAINDGNATPLRAATQRVGEYFRTGTMSGIAGSTDPIQYWCQRNFHILASDGYWNESSYSAVNGISISSSVDKTIPTLPETVVGLTPGANWGRPLYDANGAPNVGGPTLADITMHYWRTDLRSAAGDPKGKNELAPTSGNPATWQHLVFYGLGMGVDGTLAYPEDLAALQAGTKNWPSVKNNDPTAVDDLWHASLNGRGEYFSAKDPASLRASLIGALNSIKSQTAGATSSTSSSPIIAFGNNLAFRSSYTSGSWTGDLVAREVDPATGLFTVSAPVWSALAKLDATPWNTRKIVTMAGSSKVPFNFASLTTAQKTSLAVSGASVNEVIDFLRGDKTHEGTKFRKRGDASVGVKGLLGDVINARPVVVAAPREPYLESMNPGYQAYKLAKASRTTMIYLGSNDGMLHAINASANFDAGTSTWSANANSGKEEWAYIPSMLMRSTSDELGNPDGLQALAYRIEAAPFFRHHPYVDATPESADVDFNATANSGSAPYWTHSAYKPTAGSQDWRTILVGGLGKGGKGYYALDVTDGAVAADENAAASKILWEFSGTATEPMGFSFGKPLVVKTYAYGWVVLLTSGMNNSDGKGYLYVLNAKTGAVLKVLSTGVGTAATPSNLVHVAAFAAGQKDNFFVDQVYGGDMRGNLWRFDLSDPNPNNWAAKTTKLAVFQSPSPVPAQANYNGDNFQPVTVAPVMSVDKFGVRWVFVGTGMDLHADDRDINKSMTKQIQTVYALKDGSASSPLTTGLPLTRANLAAKNRNSTAAVAVGTNAGWYMDLAPVDNSDPLNIRGAERVVVQPLEAFGNILFATTLSSSDVCNPGSEGVIYGLSLSSGESILVDNAGMVIPYDRTSSGIVGDLQLVRDSTGKTSLITEQTNCADPIACRKRSDCKGGQCVGGVAAGRVSWREIVR